MKRAFFIDRPGFRAERTVRRWLLETGTVGAGVSALEPPGPRTRPSGIPVADFFAGDLRTPDGEAVYLASWRLSGQLAIDGADLILARVPVIAGINARLGRDTLRLLLAKRIWSEINAILVRMLAARAISEGDETTYVVLSQPQMTPLDVFEHAIPGVHVRFYGHTLRAYPRVRVLSRAIGGIILRRLRRWLAASE